MNGLALAARMHEPAPARSYVRVYGGWWHLAVRTVQGMTLTVCGQEISAAQQSEDPWQATRCPECLRRERKG